MTDVSVLTGKIDSLELEIAASKALAAAAILSNDREREISMNQRIAADTALLTALITERRELRLQQHQQAGEYFVCV
jgi:hypothetical protein